MFFILYDVYQWFTIRVILTPGHSEMLGDILVLLTWWEVLLAASGLMPAIPAPPPQLFKRMIWSKIPVMTRLRILGVGPHFHLVSFFLLREGRAYDFWVQSRLRNSFKFLGLRKSLFCLCSSVLRSQFFSSIHCLVFSTLLLLHFLLSALLPTRKLLWFVSLFLCLYLRALFSRIFSITGFELFD